MIKVLGHATVLIEEEDKVIYIDPYQGDLSKKADIILVSHSHYDHLDNSKIEQIRKPDTKIFTSEEAAGKIEGSIGMKPGDVKKVDGVKIEAVHAYNIDKFRSPGVLFHPKGFGIGFVVSIGEKRIFHAGDSDFIPEMKKLGKIDVAILPMSGTYVMTVDEAVEAAKTIKPNLVMPMHEFEASKEEFKRKVESAGFKVAL